MSSERHWQEETRFVFRGASHAGASGLCGFIKQHTALQVPAQPPPSAPTAAAPRRPAFRAQPLPQEIDGGLIRARDSGRREVYVDHDGRLHEGKGYPQELTQPDACSLKSGPRAKEKRAHRHIFTTTRVARGMARGPFSHQQRCPSESRRRGRAPPGRAPRRARPASTTANHMPQ